MPRLPRYEFPGAHYHIMSRGTGQRDIFLEPSDMRAFLFLLDTVVRDCGWICHGYCLLGNHYHLIIETPSANVSKGMKYLNGVYCQRFNKLHGRIGHLIQGRYFSKLITDDGYLLQLARYIVLNPVRAGICARAEDWDWSSYRATVGLCPVPRLLETGLILEQFSKDISKARDAYAKFVEDGMHLSGPPVPPDEERVDRTALPLIFRDAHDKVGRREAVRSAYHCHGYTMREIGDFLGLSRVTVSNILKSDTGM